MLNIDKYITALEVFSMASTLMFLALSFVILYMFERNVLSYLAMDYFVSFNNMLSCTCVML